MSNQYSRSKKQQHQNWNSNNKTQKIFVPKTQNRTTENPNPTLSNSLRQSQLKESNASGTSSRIRVDENGDWVASKAGAGNGGKFVNYLPQDEAVAAGLGADEGGMDPVESQRVVDLLNRELSRLLKLSPRGFWKEVAIDTSLHRFLDSFLQFKSRWYDFPNHGAKGILAGVIIGEPELSRRVFMVLYRISSNMDPGARPSESLSLKDHGVLLQEKNLLDLPKLLDICAIYGHENEDLTGLLIRNALKAQPWIHDNMTALISHFLGIVHTMHQRCSSSLETLLSPENRDHGSSLLLADFIEVMDFINDAVASLDAFIAVYKPAAVFFSCPVGTSYGNEELLGTFAKLHDSLLPSLRRGFQILVMEGDGEMISNISMNLKMLSMRIVNLGWKLLDICYLSDEMLEDGRPTPPITKMFPAEVEDPVVRADILVQTFREINGVSIQEKDNQKLDTFLQNVEKKYNVMRRLESLQNSGWVIMDDEQFHYLSGIMISSSKGALIGSTLAPSPVPTNKVHMDEDAAIMESKISQIKDLFPDYGKGFLAACLEAYNHNPEEVIERILEGTLHEDLQCLDTSLETIPLSKSDPSINSKDKGKGKLVESTAVPSIKPVAVAGGENVYGPLISSSSTVGRFVRKSRDDLPDGSTLDARNENDTAKTAALISQYEYDDEYDDSFDDLGLSIVESRLDESEMMGDSVNSNMGKARDTGTESSAQTAPNRKWGSRKTPQFYVKDGKNYSYKVAGSVAVANADEASIVTQAQGELIHGLGRGGNLPLGAVKKLMAREEQYNNQSDVSNAEGEGNSRNMSGRGGRGGRRPSEANEDQNSHSNDLEGGNGRGDSANQRGRGGRRGGGRNSYQKDRSMRKHFAGLSGY